MFIANKMRIFLKERQERQMEYESGLVLEGGGTRGVFTAGVLDFFLEKKLEFPYVIGVSAGACNALNYIAKQKGRTRKCMIDSLSSSKYVSIRKFFKDKSLFDLDLIFDIFPNRLIPFDYSTYFQYKGHCKMVATDCVLGKAVYLEEKRSKKRLMECCRASSSLPFLAPPVFVDSIPLLDGGVADSIPIKKSLLDGNKKNVLILTRKRGYRKKVSSTKLFQGKILYREYGLLRQALENRPLHYNHTMDFIEKLEEQGDIFVIRPQIKPIDRTEQNPETLTSFYLHGYDYARRIYPKLIQYLEKTKK